MTRILRPLQLMTVALALIAFQNCSEFVPTAQFQETMLASTSPFWVEGPGAPALVLPLNPFTANGGSQATPFDFDFTNALVMGKIGNLDPSTTYLSNDYISLDQDTAFPNALVKPTDSFTRTALEPEFAHVNTYFHIDRLASALKRQSLFPSAAFQRLHVNPHCDEGPSAVNNAYFNPEEDLLCMGHADVGNVSAWSSLDADVIVHEFGHALNHTYSTDDILWSSNEAGAMDEGLADVWAFLQNDNPYIAVWYQAAIYRASGIDLGQYTGLRDLSTEPVYPDDLVGEIHDDSSLLTSSIYELRRSGSSVDALRKLNVRVLSALQTGARFDEAIRTMRTEAASLGLDMNVLNSSLQRRQLLRKDDISGLTFNPATDLFVIDNHVLPSFQAGGNCNASLDAGETILLYLNVTNPTPTYFGSVAMRLETTASPDQIRILPGGEYGTLMRLKPNSNYRQSDLGTRGTDLYSTNLVLGSFAVRALPGASGPYTFKAKLVGFDTVDQSPVTKEFTFTMNVGSVATINGSCPGTGESSVLP